MKYPSHIPSKHFVTVPHDKKLSLLGGALDAIDLNFASNVLCNLRQISPSAAKGMALKTSAIEDLAFRVVPKDVNRDVRNLKSFVALSYVWRMDRSQEVSKEPRIRKFFNRLRSDSSKVDIPVAPELFQFVMDLLKDDEALWFDKGCIHQEDIAETRHAISAMDLVYNSARLVIAVLEDVVIDEEEAELISSTENMNSFEMLEHMERMEERLEGVALQRLIVKLFSSKYFTRAWCAHEMGLAKSIKFVVRRESNKPFVLLRSDLQMLIRSSRRNEKKEIFRNSVVINSFLGNTRGQKTFHLKNNRKQPLDGSANMLWQATNIMLLQAGGNPGLSPEMQIADGIMDKLSIVLNSSGIGLILDRTQFTQEDYLAMNPDDCHRRLLLISLAAGSPVPLLTVGHAISFGTQSKSWLRKMQTGGVGHKMFDPEWLDHCALNSDEGPLWQYKVDDSDQSQYIEIDVLFSSSTEKVHYDRREKFSRLAHKFMDSGPPKIYNSRLKGVAREWELRKLVKDQDGNKNHETVLAMLIKGAYKRLEPIETKDYSNVFSSEYHIQYLDDLFKAAYDVEHLKSDLNLLLTDDWKHLQQPISQLDCTTEAGMAALRVFKTVHFLRKHYHGAARTMVSLEFDGTSGKGMSLCRDKERDLAFAIPTSLACAKFKKVPCCWALEKKINSDGSEDWIARERLRLWGTVFDSLPQMAEDRKALSKRIRVWGS